MGAVVGAGAAGCGRDEQVVEAAAEGLGRPLGVVEGHLEHLDAAPQRSLGPQRRVGVVGHDHLSERRTTELDGVLGQAGHLRGVAGQGGRALHGATGDAQGAAELVGEGVDGGLHQVPGDRLRHRPVGGDGLGGVARQVDELLRHPDAALAVGDGVVELLHHGAAPALQALDDHELPEGAGAVEGRVDEGRGQVQQLPQRTRRRQGDPAQVVVQVEVGLLAPLRRGQPAEGGDHPLVQARDHRHRPLQPGAEAVGIRRDVEHGDVGDRGAQVRVLLEVPHQGLDVGHATLVAHLAFAGHRRRR
jgi:hypothetical protein